MWSLETLHLQYNQLKTLPCSLASISSSLSVLSLAGNPWEPR
jgi:Leucine-rich repeat (LRR) protein